MNNGNNKILDYGNCDFVKSRGKEAYVKIASLRTETFYKADAKGELAQHTETHSSFVEIKNEVAQWKFIHLPREISFQCGVGFKLPSKHSGLDRDVQIEKREVSRDHSSQRKRAGSSCQ